MCESYTSTAEEALIGKVGLNSELGKGCVTFDAKSDPKRNPKSKLVKSEQLIWRVMQCVMCPFGHVDEVGEC